MLLNPKVNQNKRKKERRKMIPFIHLGILFTREQMVNVEDGLQLGFLSFLISEVARTIEESYKSIGYTQKYKSKAFFLSVICSRLFMTTSLHAIILVKRYQRLNGFPCFPSKKKKISRQKTTLLSGHYSLLL